MGSESLYKSVASKGCGDSRLGCPAARIFAPRVFVIQLVTPITAPLLLVPYPPRDEGALIVTYSRRAFLENSITATAALTGAPLLAGFARKPALSLSKGGDFPSTTPPPKPAFPVTDFHVHLSPTLTINQAIALGKERGVHLGIVDHPGPGFPINSDADLQRYIDRLRSYPVRIGLQPVYPGWSKAFSKAVLAQLDYVLMDALTLPNSDGSWLPIWQIDTMVDDADAFMTRYMQFIEQILTTEPIDIFGWPTFLPVPIARDYSRLWTSQRIDRILELAKKRKIAIEINEVAHVPDENFIREAKRAGLKFTFGTDSRNQNATHFHYCYQMATRCALTDGDMFTVNRRHLVLP